MKKSKKTNPASTPFDQSTNHKLLFDKEGNALLRIEHQKYKNIIIHNLANETIVGEFFVVDDNDKEVRILQHYLNCDSSHQQCIVLDKNYAINFALDVWGAGVKALVWKFRAIDKKGERVIPNEESFINVQLI